MKATSILLTPTTLGTSCRGLEGTGEARIHKGENERIAQARRESQEAYERAQEGAPDSEGEQSYMERMRERWERERKSQEAYEKRQQEEDEKKRAEIEAERKRMAEEQTAKDKARLKRDYLMAGGDPALWEDFWKEVAPKIIARRIADAQKRAARPGRDY